MITPVVGQMREGLTGVEFWDGYKWVRIESQQDRIERKLDRILELLERPPEPKNHKSAVEELTEVLNNQIIRSKCG